MTSQERTAGGTETGEVRDLSDAAAQSGGGWWIEVGALVRPAGTTASLTQSLLTSPHHLEPAMTRILPDELAAGLSTRAIHAGQRPEPQSGAIMTPLYLTSTYVQQGIGHNTGYEYARGKNPTREALERNVASLESGQHGFAFGSGLGCLDSIMKLFRAGDHVVVGENVYGGTFRLFDKILQHFGLSFTYVDTRDPQRVADAMTEATRALLIETPTNPLMRLADLPAMAEIAKRHEALLVVDNTFATPVFQRPLEMGADIVWHSTTKYLNGHSDMIGGVAVVLEDELAARLQFIQNAAGAVPGPFDCWLALRGTKTLPLRMKQHDANGRQVAAWLAERIGFEQVDYPGLPSHPQHELAKRQMSGFGGMMTIELGSVERANKVLQRLRVFSLAESLGGVESLISHPYSMTHGSVPAEVKAQMGLTDGMIRLSCGVEDVEDLIGDLEQALA
jgi:cystathionine gamma-lyase